MYVADKLRALKLREAKSWKVIDAYLAMGKNAEKISAQVRLEAAVFILKRLYPEKVQVGGDSENPIKIIIEQEDFKLGDSSLQIASRPVCSISGSN